MKKKKLTFLTDIAVLVLCVCAIAIGVYSAKNASINIGGSVGFNAHDCKVRVLGKISGAYDKDGNKLTENNASATVLFADATDTTKGKLITGTSAENNWIFGNIYYNDLTAPNSYSLAEDIVFTFEITNESAYDVAFKVIKPTSLPDNIVSSISIDNNEQTEETENDATLLSKRGDKVTVVLTLRLGYEEDINTANNFNGMQFNFYKPSADDAVTTIDSNFRYQVYPATKTAVVTGLASNATELAIPATITISGDTYAVKKIEASSFNDVNITSVEIPASITSIGDYAFYGCTSLRQINIPSTVKHIGVEAFTGTPFLGNYSGDYNQEFVYSEMCPNGIYTCKDGKKILLANLNESTEQDLTDVYLLASCVYLGVEFKGNLTLPLTLEYIGKSAFENSTGFAELTLPTSLKGIDNQAFSSTKLTNITIPANVETIGENPFTGCTSLASIKVDKNNKYYSDGGVNAIIEVSTDTIITGTTIIPEGIKTVGNFAFAGCTKIPTMPNSLVNIGECAFMADANGEPDINDIYSNDSDYLVENESQASALSLPTAIKYIGQGAFQLRNDISSVTIPNAVTKIETGTFSGCTQLSTVNLSNVNEIGDSAFLYCSSLTSISLPQNLTTIGEGAFIGTGLTKLTIPNNVTSIGDSAFSGTQIKEVIIESSNLYIGRFAFLGTEFLENNPTGMYTCSDGKKVIIERALITELTIPEGITSVGGYSGCTNLKKVTMPDTVKRIEDFAFSGCTNLIDIKIPNSVTSIGGSAFSGCTGLTSTTIGNGVTSIGGSAFSGCTSLTSITIGNSVTSISYRVFYNCTNLTTVIIPSSVTSIGSSAFYKCTNLTSITIGNSVTSIGSSAFYNCTNLTTVTIPNSVTSIGSSAFLNCTSLAKVNISNIEKWCNIDFRHVYSNPLHNNKAELYLNNEKITALEIPLGVKEIKSYTFYGGTSLTSVTIQDSVTNIGDYAFYNCKSLSSVTIGNSVTSIGSSAFEYCTNLTTVTIPNSIISIDSFAFYHCTNLTSITIGNSVTSIGSSAFYNCTNLTTVTIPNSVTSIGSSAFNSTGLTSITIGNGVKQVGREAFNGCTSLTKVNISNLEKWWNIDFYSGSSNPLSNGADLILNGNKVTEVVIPFGLKSIPNYAMYNYKGLTSLTIPANVTEIGYQAFYNCTNLDRVNITDLTAWEKIKFGYDGNNNPLINNAGLYVNGEAITKLTINDDNFNYYAYSGCSTLTSAEYTYNIKKIPQCAFYKCVNIESIKLLDDSTLEVIEGYAFYGCTKLSTINIPSSIRYVGLNTGIPSTNGVYVCSDGNKILLKPLSSVPEGVYLVADDVYGNLRNGSSPSTIILPKTLKYLCGGMNSFNSSHYEYWTNGGYLTRNSDEFYCTYYYDSQNSVQMKGLSYWDIYPYKYVYLKTTCKTLPAASEVSIRTTSTTEKDGYICYIRTSY